MPKTPVISCLSETDGDLREPALAILAESFGDRERYGEERIRQELVPLPPPFYREFFVARCEGRVLGVGGVKAADWASDTHILYLSAVAAGERGHGYARALLVARLEWLGERFRHGRVLVSTAKTRRFREAGFRTVSKDGKSERELMLLEF